MNLTSKSKAFVLVDPQVVDEQWARNEGGHDGWIVDFGGDHAAHFGQRQAHYPRETLADGTVRVKCPNAQVAAMITDEALKSATRDALPLTVSCMPLGATRRVICDAVRNEAQSPVRWRDFAGIAFSGRSVTVEPHKAKDGKIDGVLLRFAD